MRHTYVPMDQRTQVCFIGVRIYSIILERLKGKGLGYINTYGGHRYNKRTN